MSTGRKIGLAVIGGILVLVLGVGLSLYGYVNNVRNDGISQENNLTALYKNNQNELSSLVITVQETLGIADRNSERIEEILTAAVQGRYDGEMDPGQGGEMFSAITEAYPDISANSEAFTRVQDVVVSGRQAFKNKQSLLLDNIQAYDNWREQGFMRSGVVNSLGFPSDRLVAIGSDGQPIYGREALDKMRALVLDDGTIADFSDGTTGPLITPKDE